MSKLRSAEFNLVYVYEVWRAMGVRAAARGPVRRWLRASRARRSLW